VLSIWVRSWGLTCEADLQDLCLAHAGGQHRLLDVGVEELGLGLGDPAEILRIDPERPDGPSLRDAGGQGELADREHLQVVFPHAVLGQGNWKAQRLVDPLDELHGPAVLGADV
jgi:hypothetical protein